MNSDTDRYGDTDTDMVRLSLKKYEGLKSVISNCGNAI